MFYVVAKKFAETDTYEPMQIASSFDEGVELIIGLETCDPSEVEEIETAVDPAGNVYRCYRVWADRHTVTEYSVSQLKRS